MTQQKSLGFWMLTALVAGNAIGSGIFLLPASLAAYGSIGLVAWLITSLGAIFLALVYGRLSRIMPKTGGPYAYCQAAYGDFVGFQIAYNYWIALWIGNAAIVVALVGYLSVFWPILNEDRLIALITSLGVLWLITWLNVLGIKEAGRFQLVITILKILPLILIAGVGFFYVETSNIGDFNISGHSNMAALTATITLTLWSFVGIESATVPAGDVENPRRNIPRATLIGTLIAAFVYISCTLVVMGVIPADVLVSSASPYADAGAIIFGPMARKIIALVAVIACVGTLNGWILMQGQIPLAAARDNLFPKAFAKVSMNGTPIFGLVVSSILITLLLSLRYGGSLVEQFTFIILLATMASLLTYLFTSVAEIALHNKKHDLVKNESVTPAVVLGLLAFGYLFWAALGNNLEVVYYGTMLFFSSIVAYALFRLVTPEKLNATSSEPL